MGVSSHLFYLERKDSLGGRDVSQKSKQTLFTTVIWVKDQIIMNDLCHLCHTFQKSDVAKNAAERTSMPVGHLFSPMVWKGKGTWRCFESF